ncbi:hypothetical protein GJAV_G00242160 [Gymnothorax javanicus]|nr:hypothetical protein GJAV_G00242160 [Gymnothorax javanicus]
MLSAICRGRELGAAAKNRQQAQTSADVHIPPQTRRRRGAQLNYLHTSPHTSLSVSTPSSKQARSNQLSVGLCGYCGDSRGLNHLQRSLSLSVCLCICLWCTLEQQGVGKHGPTPSCGLADVFWACRKTDGQKSTHSSVRSPGPKSSQSAAERGHPKALSMAENGAESVPEPSPLNDGDVGSSECQADGLVFPLSKSAVDVVADPMVPDELRKSSSSPLCSRTASEKSAKTPPMDDCDGGSLDDSNASECQHTPHGRQETPEMIDKTGQLEVTVTRPDQSRPRGSHQSTGEAVFPRQKMDRPRSIAEIAPSHWTEMASRLLTTEVGSSSSHSDLREDHVDSTPQPFQRSQSTGLHSFREVSRTHPYPCRSDIGASFPAGRYCGQDVPCCPTLVCKQPMQLLQSNTLTTCRSSEEDRCLHHHSGMEDTFAAYCHPLPIPAPAQLQPRSTRIEGSRPSPPHHTLLAFPRLMSSVSETGLDAKRLISRCSGADCPEQDGAYSKPISLQIGIPPREGRVMRDMGTMTSQGELRDVGVQTGSPETPPPHVFPKVNLADNGGLGADSEDVSGEGSNGAVGGQKSPIKEVLWDSEGMTWEVYGASVDPEELGLAIQKHLELQIKEKASCVAKLTRQDTLSSQPSQRRRKRGFTLGGLRNPTCCARSSTVVD